MLAKPSVVLHVGDFHTTRGPTSKISRLLDLDSAHQGLICNCGELNYVLTASIGVDRELLDHCFVHGASGPPRIQAWGLLRAHGEVVDCKSLPALPDLKTELHVD